MPVSAETFRALGDKTRLTLFELLLQRPHRVNELVERLAVAQPLVSRHLRVLKDAGLVVDRREGRAVEYRISSGDRAPAILLRDWAVDAARRAGGAAAAIPASSARGARTSSPPMLDDSRSSARARDRESASESFIVHKPIDAFDSYLL